MLDVEVVEEEVVEVVEEMVVEVVVEVVELVLLALVIEVDVVVVTVPSMADSAATSELKYDGRTS
ncbi:MAG TPA: hypothetical protein VFE98_02070 [Candidatus Bathyarchaeia archaeon]|nr:hypothetical protein [Candidatus Bathyarchaeia archaeon]